MSDLLDEFEEVIVEVDDTDSVVDTSEDVGSGTRGRQLLRDIGIEADVMRLREKLRGAKTRLEIEGIKAKLDAWQKLVLIYKTAAETAQKNSRVQGDDDFGIGEIKVSLVRDEA